MKNFRDMLRIEGLRECERAGEADGHELDDTPGESGDGSASHGAAACFGCFDRAGRLIVEQQRGKHSVRETLNGACRVLHSTFFFQFHRNIGLAFLSFHDAFLVLRLFVVMALGFVCWLLTPNPILQI